MRVEKSNDAIRREAEHLRMLASSDAVELSEEGRARAEGAYRALMWACQDIESYVPESVRIMSLQ